MNLSTPRSYPIIKQTCVGSEPHRQSALRGAVHQQWVVHPRADAKCEGRSSVAFALDSSDTKLTSNPLASGFSDLARRRFGMGIALLWESRSKAIMFKVKTITTKRSGYWFSVILSALGCQILKENGMRSSGLMKAPRSWLI